MEKPYGGAPVLEVVGYEQGTLKLRVHEGFQDRPEDFFRLKMLLAAVCDAHDVSALQDGVVWVHSKADLLKGVTVDELNADIAGLAQLGNWKRVVRKSQTHDMAVNVVVRSEATITDYHVSAIVEKLVEHGVSWGALLTDEFYGGDVFRLCVPELDMGVTLDTIEEEVSKVLDVRFVG